MTTVTGTVDLEDHLVSRIAPIVDLDAYVVEPLEVWSSRDVGVDHIAFVTDDPHTDGTRPRSREATATQFGHLESRSIAKIAGGNVIELFGLSLAA